MLRPLEVPGLLMPAWLAEAAQMLLSSPQALAACAAYAGALVCLLRPRLIDGLFQLDEEDVRRREQESAGALRLLVSAAAPIVLCSRLCEGSFFVGPLVIFIYCQNTRPSFRFFDRLLLMPCLVVGPGVALLRVWYPELGEAIVNIYCPIPELRGDGRLARREILLRNGWALLIQSRVSRQLCVSLGLVTQALIYPLPGRLDTALMATMVFCALMSLKTSEMAQRFSQAANKVAVAGLVVGFSLELALIAVAICPSLPELSAHQAAQTRHLASAVVFGLALACHRWPGRVESLLDLACGQQGIPRVAQEPEHSTDAFVYLVLGVCLFAIAIHSFLEQWPAVIAASAMTILLSRMHDTVENCSRCFHLCYLVLIPMVEAIIPGLAPEYREFVPIPLVFGPFAATALYTRPAVPLSLILFTTGVGILTGDSMRYTLLKLCLAGLTCIAIITKGTFLHNRAMVQVAHVFRAMQLNRIFDLEHLLQTW